MLTEDFLKVISNGADNPTKSEEFERFQVKKNVMAARFGLSIMLFFLFSRNFAAARTSRSASTPTS